MTKYETIAVILSIIAILSPIIQWGWKKWIQKEKLNYYPNGRATLFFNQSGSYIEIDGVYEAVNKSIVIKKIDLRITRRKDGKKLNLSWSSLISPVNQNVYGMGMQTTKTTEMAHPFRIEGNSIICAFIEFADTFNSAGKNFSICTKELYQQIKQMDTSTINYEQAIEKYMALKEYQKARDSFEKEFYWEIGKYDVVIDVNYDKKCKIFRYEMNVEEADSSQLRENIDESLIAFLKQGYGVKWNFKSIDAELHTVNK